MTHYKKIIVIALAAVALVNPALTYAQQSILPINKDGETVNVARIPVKVIKDILSPTETGKYADDVDGSREAADKARARAQALEDSKEMREFLQKQQDGIKATAKPEAVAKPPKAKPKAPKPSDPKETIRIDKDFKEWVEKGRFKPGGCRGC